MGVKVYSTYYEDNVIVKDVKNCGSLDFLMPCNHQEADSRLFLHLFDASERQGHRKALIKTVDSDVPVIAIGVFKSLKLEELYIEMGTSRAEVKIIPIHEVVNTLGPEKSAALPLFHSFTGCDSTPSFFGIGKKTAWGIWESFPELTGTLNELTQNPELFSPVSVHMEQLERFVVLLYSKGSGCSKVNEARKMLFSHGKRLLDGIPPTQDALYQHIRRSLLQAAFIWGKCLHPEQYIPDVTEWGWTNESGRLVPFWTVLADVSQACSLLIHCNCTKSCTRNCKCSKASLHCTSVCKCEGGCINC